MALDIGPNAPELIVCSKGALNNDGTKVKLVIEMATDGTSALPGFVGPEMLEFTVGTAAVCEAVAVERAVREMKLDERALVTCTKPALCTDAQLGLADTQSERVVFQLHLVAIV